MGHHLHHQLSGRDWMDSNDPETKDIRAAIESTPTAKSLNREARYSGSGPAGKFIKEQATPHEKFARAYEQYITTKSGDEKMGKQLSAERGSAYYGKQLYWPSGEFSGIVQAFDNHFKKKGWK